MNYGFTVSKLRDICYFKNTVTRCLIFNILTSNIAGFLT